MQQDAAHPFDTIESAQDFMSLLQESIEEARQDVERDLADAASLREQRREEALQLTLFKMRQLASHVEKSQRILNDLRTMRRLLFAERKPRSVPASTSS